MSITLESTSKSSTANSYVASLSEANAYAAELATLGRFEIDTSAWSAATDAAKLRALTLAADAIDTATFRGVRETTDQAREWPRVRTGLLRLDQSIPDGIKLAQVAEAASMLATPSKADAALRDGIASESFGGKSVAFDLSKVKAARGSRTIATATSEILAAYRLVGPGGGNAGSVYVGRG